jgi:hypothetical protein
VGLLSPRYGKFLSFILLWSVHSIILLAIPSRIAELCTSFISLNIFQNRIWGKYRVRIFFFYIYKSVCMYVCMYVCMFRRNYLLVNSTVSFPSFTWLCKHREEYKQGEMWHFAQRTEISENICMFQPGLCQATGKWLISAETNNEELLIARQRFRNHGYIDGNNWSRRL